MSATAKKGLLVGYGGERFSDGDDGRVRVFDLE